MCLCGGGVASARLSCFIPLFSEMEQLLTLEGLPNFLLTYSLPIVPEERSFSGAIVTQGNDQS